MEKILYTYALIKTLSDNNEDYIDSFLPLIIQSFPEDGELALYSILRNTQGRIPNRYPKSPPRVYS